MYAFDLPVVHQNVWLPQPVRWYPEISDTAVLRRIPSQIHVVPFLHTHEKSLESTPAQGKKRHGSARQCTPSAAPVHRTFFPPPTLAIIDPTCREYANSCRARVELFPGRFFRKKKHETPKELTSFSQMFVMSN